MAMPVVTCCVLGDRLSPGGVSVGVFFLFGGLRLLVVAARLLGKFFSVRVWLFLSFVCCDFDRFVWLYSGTRLRNIH